MSRGVPIADIDLSKIGPNSPLHAFRNRRPQKTKRDLEHVEQVLLMQWRDTQLGAHSELAGLVAVPNGGKRPKRTAGRLKAEGVSAGYPDLVLDVARGGYFGWRGELKADRGRASDSQLAWHGRLRLRGFRVDVAIGWEAMRDALLAYVTLPDTIVAGPPISLGG